MASLSTLTGRDWGLHIVFLGDPNIGQSTLLKYFRKEPNLSVRQIMEQLDKNVHLIPQHQSYILNQNIDGQPHRLRITDSGGNKIFNRMRKAILSTAHCVVLCFSINDRKSLDSIKKTWVPLVKSLAFSSNKEDQQFFKPYVVLGLRSDLRRIGDVSYEEGARFAESVDAMSYLECSIYEDESVLDNLRMKIFSQAKESYVFRMQHKRLKRAIREKNNDLLDQYPSTSEPYEQFISEALTIEEDVRPLTREDIQPALSCLGTTPCLRHAYLQLDLPDLGLTSCDAIRKFSSVQFVDVSGNNLRSLEPLGELPFLLRLNASKNQIVRTQSFGPPRHLEICDLSYNMIGEIGNWGCHRMLRELSLRGNFITNIPEESFQKNNRLKMLDLSENHISQIENLQGVPLEALYLAQNQLKSLDGIECLTSLAVVNVRGNLITVTDPLQNLPNLRKLCITENRIKCIVHIEMLPRSLADLYISPNPVSELPHFRLQVLRRQSQLRLLDSQDVTPQEQVKANVAYGDDLSQQEAVFTHFLPREQFIDRRLVTSDGIEKRELDQFGFVGQTGPVEEVQN